ELAVGAAAAEHPPDGRQPRLHRLLEEALADALGAVGLAHRDVDHAAGPAVADLAAYDVEQGDEVVADRLARQRRERLAHGGQRVDDQVFLVGPAPVDRGLAHTGAGRDRLDGQLGDAQAFGDQVEGGLDDRLLGLLTARTARAGL